eukprot:TRINITY_DN641_c0_g1_i1.p1 TRINITY_DN641_c0_g1~~TRINITY_DN641_c0_g1_i1.p1  ORF type:complete len:178 (-),score=73.40 TRINITY_DN641_c0_g1_i1:282-815(-)
MNIDLSCEEAQADGKHNDADSPDWKNKSVWMNYGGPNLSTEEGLPFLEKFETRTFPARWSFAEEEEEEQFKQSLEDYDLGCNCVDHQPVVASKVTFLNRSGNNTFTMEWQGIVEVDGKDNYQFGFKTSKATLKQLTIPADSPADAQEMLALFVSNPEDFTLHSNEDEYYRFVLKPLP